MNKEKNFISAVIYVTEDENNIENFVKKLIKILSNKFLNYEMIFVNDGCDDKIIKKIKNIVSKEKNASSVIVNMSFYQGKEISMNAGLDIAIGDFVYEFDTINIDYDINLIWDVYKKALEGNDIVNACSNKQYFTSKIFYKIFNKYSNFQYKINSNTFLILSRRAINRMGSLNKSIPYRKAILANSGLKASTIYYESNNKKKKINNRIKDERKNNAIDSLILFTNVSYKVSFIFTLAMLISILIISIYTITVFIIGKPIQGWTTIMLFLSFGFTGIFLLYTIIIKYLAIIINLVFKKVNYLIESIEKIK